MKFAFVFPGQGSQSLGMLAEFAEHAPLIKTTFAEASDALGFDLWSMSQTDEVRLNQTEFTQPALLTASIALWRLWQVQYGAQPSYLAGHSLGEYTALVAAEALQFTDAVKLVQLRGQYMQAAVPAGQGAMAAILGLQDEQVLAVCKAASHIGIVTPANLNAPGQVVIAGEQAAVQEAGIQAKAAGALKVVPLAVSAPSHCPLMKPAAERLQDALAQIKITPCKIPVVNNVAAQIENIPESIKHALVAQLVEPVRWVAVIQQMASLGVTQVLECGPGKVLTGLGKRIDPNLKYASLGQYADFNQLIKEFSHE